MRKLLLMLLFILLLPAMVSCGSRNQASYHGYLYFAQSHYLMRFGLKDGSLSVVTNLGDKTILDISSFMKNRLLIVESALINRRKVHRISWMDVKTGQMGALYPGMLARYLEGSGYVVYDDRERLFAVSLAGDSDVETVFTHKTNQLSTMMVVSEDTLLFEISDARDPLIHSYNVITSELQTLDRHIDAGTESSRAS